MLRMISERMNTTMNKNRRYEMTLNNFISFIVKAWMRSELMARSLSEYIVGFVSCAFDKVYRKITSKVHISQVSPRFYTLSTL